MAGHQYLTNLGEDYYYDVRKRKKKRGFRTITAPSPKLKELQKEFSEWFYDINKKEFDENPQITGFMPGKSIADNARPHLNKEWLLTMDIADFFPTTDEASVKQALSHLPKSRHIMDWFKKEKPLGFKRMPVSKVTELLTIKSGLPQGSPASPIIANYCGIKEVDKRVQAVLLQYSGIKDICYTRYADDISISFNKGTRSQVIELAEMVKTAVNRGKYKIKDNKTDIKHRSQRQLVTGVIVNGDNTRIDKRLMNKMRAAMHQTKIKGGELSSENQGMLSFIQSVNKEQHQKLIKQLGDQNECNRS